MVLRLVVCPPCMYMVLRHDAQAQCLNVVLAPGAQPQCTHMALGHVVLALCMGTAQHWMRAYAGTVP